ncbi:hypothetical protein QTP88_018391 [Uroleucon formosanum]
MQRVIYGLKGSHTLQRWRLRQNEAGRDYTATAIYVKAKDEKIDNIIATTDECILPANCSVHDIVLIVSTLHRPTLGVYIGVRGPTEISRILTQPPPPTSATNGRRVRKNPPSPPPPISTLIGCSGGGGPRRRNRQSPDDGPPLTIDRRQSHPLAANRTISTFNTII